MRTAWRRFGAVGVVLTVVFVGGCPDSGNNPPPPPPKPNPGDINRLSPMYPVSPNYQPPADRQDFPSSATPRPGRTIPTGPPDVGAGAPPPIHTDDADLSAAELRRRRDGAYAAYQSLLVSRNATAQQIIDARNHYSYWDALYQQAVARSYPR